MEELMEGDLHTWHKKLKAKQDACELTQDDAKLLCLLDIRNNLIHNSQQLEELVESQGHVEGVIGSVDELLQKTYGPVYPGLERGKLGTGRPPTNGQDIAGALTGGG